MIKCDDCLGGKHRVATRARGDENLARMLSVSHSSLTCSETVEVYAHCLYRSSERPMFPLAYLDRD